jgi:RNA polymerase sigma-70 factor (ECF subfamily)
MRDHDPRGDPELLAAAGEDVEAFGVFYRRHATWVLGFLARRLGDPELAADVTSEVFAAALLASDRYDPRLGEANSWLFGIASRQLGSAVRRGVSEDRARRRLGMERVAVDADDVAWIASLAATQGGDRATELLSELPGDQRELVAARVIDERSYDELAGEYGLSQAAVRKRVSRGLATLRARLREGDGTR